MIMLRQLTKGIFFPALIRFQQNLHWHYSHTDQFKNCGVKVARNPRMEDKAEHATVNPTWNYISQEGYVMATA